MKKITSIIIISVLFFGNITRADNSCEIMALEGIYSYDYIEATNEIVYREFDENDNAYANIKGEKLGPYDMISAIIPGMPGSGWLIFSDTGNSYMFQIYLNGKNHLVINGELTEGYDDIQTYGFVQGSDEYGYIAAKYIGQTGVERIEVGNMTFDPKDIYGRTYRYGIQEEYINAIIEKNAEYKPKYKIVVIENVPKLYSSRTDTGEFMVANGVKEKEYIGISLIKIPENVEDGSVYGYVGKTAKDGVEYVFNGEIKMQGLANIYANYLAPDGNSYAFFGLKGGEKVLVLDGQVFKTDAYASFFSDYTMEVLTAGYNKTGDEFAFIIKDSLSDGGYKVVAYKKDNGIWAERDMTGKLPTGDLLYTFNGYPGADVHAMETVSRNQFVILAKQENGEYKGIFNTGNRKPWHGLDWYYVSARGDIRATYLFHRYNMSYSDNLESYAYVDTETGDLSINGKYIKKMIIPPPNDSIGGPSDYVYPKVFFSRDGKSYAYTEPSIVDNKYVYYIVKDGIYSEAYDYISSVKYIGDTYDILFMGSKDGKRHLVENSCGK